MDINFAPVDKMLEYINGGVFSKGVYSCNNRLSAENLPTRRKEGVSDLKTSKILFKSVVVSKGQDCICVHTSGKMNIMQVP